MTGIVVDLQKDILDSSIDTLNLLRKAYLVARKLKLKDFEEWVYNELNGYKSTDKIPDYRNITGELNAWNHRIGWNAVALPNNEVQNLFCRKALADSIANLQKLSDSSSDGRLTGSFTADVTQILIEKTGVNTTFILKIGANQLYNIIEIVRNHLLEWAITLEEHGVLGEDMQFTDTELATATSTAPIYNYTANFYGNVENAQVQQDSTASTQEIDF